ncbi:uncharacterized protein L203_101558 [Cryptococcus depauperatus CBS 7841]|uniref:Secreted protein n=1 Tax=Cryptococcus depauperatus CBS 7841 TaxID=1295531 RepID=A0AAJ8JQ54_9TREE
MRSFILITLLPLLSSFGSTVSANPIPLTNGDLDAIISEFQTLSVEILHELVDPHKAAESNADGDVSNKSFLASQEGKGGEKGGSITDLIIEIGKKIFYENGKKIVSKYIDKKPSATGAEGPQDLAVDTKSAEEGESKEESDQEEVLQRVKGLEMLRNYLSTHPLPPGAPARRGIVSDVFDDMSSELYHGMGVDNTDGHARRGLINDLTANLDLGLSTGSGGGSSGAPARRGLIDDVLNPLDGLSVESGGGSSDAPARRGLINDLTANLGVDISVRSEVDQKRRAALGIFNENSLDGYKKKYGGYLNPAQKEHGDATPAGSSKDSQLEERDDDTEMSKRTVRHVNLVEERGGALEAMAGHINVEGFKHLTKPPEQKPVFDAAVTAPAKRGYRGVASGAVSFWSSCFWPLMSQPANPTQALDATQSPKATQIVSATQVANTSSSENVVVITPAPRALF